MKRLQLGDVTTLNMTMLHAGVFPNGTIGFQSWKNFFLGTNGVSMPSSRILKYANFQWASGLILVLDKASTS